MKGLPAMKGSAECNVSTLKTGKPWLYLPIAENNSRKKTSPPARNATCLKPKTTYIIRISDKKKTLQVYQSN